MSKDLKAYNIFDLRELALEIFREEISRVLALLGCRSIADLGPQCLQFVNPHLRSATLSRPGLRSVADTKAAAEA